MNNPNDTLSLSTILGKAENLHTDKEYQECTLEQATQFDKQRNYTYDTELEEYKKQAQEMWSDSCTTPRKPNEIT